MTVHKGYSSYTATGIDAIPALPSHWALKKLKHVAIAKNSNVDKKSADGELPVRLCNYTDVYYNDVIVGDLDFMNATATADELQAFSLRAGDCIITKDSETADDIGIPALVDESATGVVCGYHLTLIRPGDDAAPAYLHRCLASEPTRYQFYLAASGVTRYGLSVGGIGGLVVPLPPRKEQEHIAAFLDRETARIDALVEKKQRLVELLKEKRQAVITQAVTRGLDPTVPMKESGVEWLGEVPAHWTVAPIARVANKITNGYVGPTRDVLVDEGIRYVQSLHIKRQSIDFERRPYFVSEEWSATHAKSILREGDVVVVQTGDIGAVACVPREFDGVNCHALIIVGRFQVPMLGRFLMFVLASDYGFTALKSIQTGALHPHLNCDWVKTVSVPVPPLEDQQAILTTLSERLNALDRIVERTEASIKLLNEHRSALITAAVTGQIDVRDAA